MSVLRVAAVVLLSLLGGAACGDARSSTGPSGAPPEPPKTRKPADQSLPSQRSTTRRDGNLVVEWPTTHAPMGHGRLRTHVVGPLNAQATRYWAGPTRVPEWLPLRRDALELFLLDETPEGFFALYREPYDATPTGCGLSGARQGQNCEFAVALFAPDGTERWAHRLNDSFSRPDQLEVQDVRYFGGVVYFNEACQSYSREARGRCSALVALDPSTGEVRFRTRPLVSNGELVMLEQYVLASYGFTAESDTLSLVSRSTGVIAARMPLPIAAEHIEVVSASPTRAVVDLELTERDEPWRVAIEALDQPHPRFVPETAPPERVPSRFPTLRMGMRDRDRPPGR